MDELWKPIEGFEGRYEISNLSRVRSVVYNNTRIMKQWISSTGYPSITLSLNGNNNRRIHRLVAQAFIPNPENKPHINHKNGIKVDNRIENLEWVTRSENELHKFRILGVKTGMELKLGKKHFASKPVLQFSKNREFIKEWECASQVYREIGICSRAIGCCCRKNKYNKSAGGFIWEFK